MLAMVEKVGV